MSRARRSAQVGASAPQAAVLRRAAQRPPHPGRADRRRIPAGGAAQGGAMSGARLTQAALARGASAQAAALGKTAP